jgi:hypothetical protein
MSPKELGLMISIEFTETVKTLNRYIVNRSVINR